MTILVFFQVDELVVSVNFYSFIKQVCLRYYIVALMLFPVLHTVARAEGDFSHQYKPSWVFVSQSAEGTQAFINPHSIQHSRSNRFAWIGFRFREPRVLSLADSALDAVSIWSEWDCEGARYRYLQFNGYVSNRAVFTKLTPAERLTAWRPVNYGMQSSHEALFKLICSV